MNCTTEAQARWLDDQNPMAGYASSDAFPKANKESIIPEPCILRGQDVSF